MAFPRDFMWGVATSAYQIEGAVEEDGRGESIWDRFTRMPGAIKDGSSGAIACDHYHRYREDVALMHRLGVQAYRFSVAWPRVIPQGLGALNPAGLDFYSRLVDALLEAEIIPFITLYHWDLPQALQERGGWDSRATVEAFVRYADVVTRHLGDRVRFWLTHNEPWCIAFLGHHLGIFAPGVRDLGVALQTAHHVLLAHGQAVPVMRQNLGPEAQIGIGLNLTPAYPATDRPADEAAARRFDGYFNRWFLDPLFKGSYPQDLWDYYGAHVPRLSPADLGAIAAPLDFLGINYYNRVRAADAPELEPPQVEDVPDPASPRSADREIYPEGMYDTLLRVHRDYGVAAIYVTENGAAFDDPPPARGTVQDSPRRAFLQTHVDQAARALQNGVPLKGYFVWSLLDNFEWASGYTLRYGITYVDYTTQQRTVKASGDWYRDWIGRNT